MSALNLSLSPSLPEVYPYRSRINGHRARIRRWVWFLAKNQSVSQPFLVSRVPVCIALLWGVGDVMECGMVQR